MLINDPFSKCTEMTNTSSEDLEFYINGCALMITTIFGLVGRLMLNISVFYFVLKKLDLS